MLRLVAFVCAVLGAHAQSYVSSCTGNSGNLPLFTYVEGCDTAPCVVPQRQDFVLHAFFKAPRSIISMSTLATFYINVGLISIPLHYDLEGNANTCNFLNNAACPVSEDQLLHYTLRLYVEEIFPQGIIAPVELRVVEDATKDAIFCVRVPVVIAAPLSTA